MLRYPKGSEPGCLAESRSTPGATWASLGGDCKQAVREALVRDQGALCCYCQRRLQSARDRMKVEHWKARAAGGGHLTWNNLLGACLGDLDLEHDRPPGTTAALERAHCDTARGDAELFLHPVEGQGPDPRLFLRYSGAGEIRSDDARAAVDLRTLNLNATHLKRGRKAVLDALRSRLEKAGWTAANLKRELEVHENRGRRLRPEHAEFLRHHLLRWIRKGS